MDKALAHLVSRKVALGTLFLLLTVPALSAELRVTYANDPVVGNPRPDDLYTSDLEIEIMTDRFRIIAGERMFTDREIGHRFDETHLSLVKPLGTVRGWDTEVSLGVLQVGEGLLGESIQNSVHQAIGSDEVDLPYVLSDERYGTAGVMLSRDLGSVAGLRLRSDVEAYVAPELRSWIRGGIVADRPLAGSAALELGVGLRIDEVESRWLSPSIGGSSPAGHLAFVWRSTEIRWAWNEYGTRSPHLFIGFRAPISRGDRGSF